MLERPAAGESRQQRHQDERHDHRNGRPPARVARTVEDPRRLPGSRDPSPAAGVHDAARPGLRHADGPGEHDGNPRRAAGPARRARRAQDRAPDADARIRAAAAHARQRHDLGQDGGAGRFFQGRRRQADPRRHLGDGRVGDHRQHHADRREHLPRRAADVEPRHRPSDGRPRPRDRRTIRSPPQRSSTRSPAR